MLLKCLLQGLGLTRTAARWVWKRLDIITGPIMKGLELLGQLRSMISQVMQRMRGGTVVLELKKTKATKGRRKK